MTSLYWDSLLFNWFGYLPVWVFDSKLKSSQTIGLATEWQRVTIFDKLSSWSTFGPSCSSSLRFWLWIMWPMTSHQLYGMQDTCILHNNINGPNGHLFYVGGDPMMRRGMLPIIMLPDGDLRIVLHLVPFWILTIWGSVHIEETVVGWRNQLRMKTSAT